MNHWEYIINLIISDAFLYHKSQRINIYRSKVNQESIEFYDTDFLIIKLTFNVDDSVNISKTIICKEWQLNVLLNLLEKFNLKIYTVIEYPT